MKQSGWLILIFTALVLPVLAQQPANKLVLNGSLKDASNAKPVAYATISVWDDKNINIVSTYSLENGTFKIELPAPGAYKLELSCVGYRHQEMHIQFPANQLNYKIDPVLLTAGEDVLQEIKITGRKRLIEQKPGMLVYNAETDVTNKGGTAADVLRKAPILNVDAQGNVSMRGSSNLKILINGKYSGQMARSAADALNMMPAAMIKSVEIVTTPSAKYDAEGAAGVINIITQKGKSDVSGTLEASVSNLEQMLNPRISFAKNKWNATLSGHIHRLRRKEDVLLDRTSFNNSSPVNRLLQTTQKDNAAPHGSADLAITYEIDERNELSFGANTWVGNWPDDSRMTSTVRLPNGSPVEQYAQYIDASNNYLGIDMNIGYNRIFKRQGQQLTLLAQSSPSRDKSGYDAVQTSDHHELLYREVNHSKTGNREWTIQADYVHPLNKRNTLHLEAGAKIILRNVGNRYNVSASSAQNAEIMEPVTGRSDDFRYSQDVWAGYSMLKVNFKNNWYLEAGARLEATYIQGHFIYNGTAFYNNFLNFVPSATLSKKLDEWNTLNLSYTKRLTRPYIWDLNPNADASDPKNIHSGNPALKPEIAHQAELSYGLNTGSSFFMNTALFLKQTDNSIIQFVETDNNGISYSSKQNLAVNRQFGLNLSATANLTAQWGLNGNFNVNYLDYSSGALEIFRSGWATDFSLNTTYKLPRNFSVQAFGEYNTRMVTLQGYRTGRYYYSFAGKKELKKYKINITLAAVNLFNKFISQENVFERPDFYSRIDNRYYNRAVKLTVNWEFGGMYRQKERKKISNDDVNVQGRG
ncbi:MAG: TonB-dependent receptor [Chitinophagaceae bacterium]|nr:TonB-dependent receptor [Chitinophagaceae bacterium]